MTRPARRRERDYASEKADLISVGAMGGVVGTLSAIGAPDSAIHYDRWRKWHDDLRAEITKAIRYAAARAVENERKGRR